ncbi:MAG: hypothetical protein JO264_13605 [Acidisphaera sp.]|nr:hypothetical protein [Acidisphaera sp.]
MPTAIPTKAQFQKATDLTFVTGAKRAGDTILNRIDALLDNYHAMRKPQGQMILLGRLFLATDLWLKTCDRGSPEINPRRKDAVYSFYKTVVARLTEDTGVPVNLLPNWLTETFGKSMGAHGADVDLTSRSADYLSPEKAAKYRLKFSGGLAYQQKWWENDDAYIEANTIQRDPRQAGVIAAGFAGYIVTMGGEFYTGPHWAGGNNNANGRFHSSYLAGESVLCGGEMKIVNGRVLEINNESGHYQPGSPNLFMAVETLAIVGVDMAALIVAPHGLPKQSGKAYLGRFDKFAGDGIFTFANALTKARPGDTPLSRHKVATTLGANRTARTDGPSYAILKAHWKPRDQGGHGFGRRERCEECRALHHLWENMQAAIKASPGGIDQVRPADMQPAVLDPARGMQNRFVVAPRP